MKLIRLLLADKPLPLLGVVLLSLLSAALSVGVIAFVNDRMMQAEGDISGLLWQFSGLLLLLFLAATAAQVSLHVLGHRFVYRLRRTLVKRVLDTDSSASKPCRGRVFSPL